MAAALTGCTGPAPQPQPSSTVADDASAPLFAGTGPLGSMLSGNPDPSSPDFVRDLVAQVRAREDAVAACMAEQGFEYAPAVPEPADITVPDPDVPRQGTRAYVEQWGYGITTNPPDDAASYTVEQTNPAFAALSDEGKEAYFLALEGARVDVQEHADGSTGDATDGGCCEQGRLGGGDPALAAFEDEAGAYLAQLDDDGSLDDVNGRWSRCMAAEGFSFTSPTEAYLAIAGAQSGVPLDEHLVQDEAEATTVREHEMIVSLADLDCQVETGYAQAWTTARDAYEQRFLDTHVAEVEAWLEARG